MSNPLKLIKITAFGLIIVFTLSYTYYQTQDYLKGPLLEIREPLNNSTQTQEKITVRGTAKNISFLSLDGRQIFTSPTGKFSEDILLSKGYNVIEIVAQDKYERTNKKIIQLIYKPN